MKIMILYCRDIETVDFWINACEKRTIEHKCVDISNQNWMALIRSAHPDLILLQPPGHIESDKIMFDERLYVISKILRYKTFPTYEEILIYENKKMLSYFLEAYGLSHPDTKVFYIKQEALDYVQHCDYPIVMKSSIGASGIGVMILREPQKAVKYVKQAFSKKGVPMLIGPNRAIGSLGKWLKKAMRNIGYAKNRLSQYRRISIYRPRNVVIMQKYIPHEFEWRVIVIGNSYYANQKTKYKDKCSGSKGIEYINPPKALLDYVRNICQKMRIHSAAFDMFEYNGEYLLNEVQAIFGISPRHDLMRVNEIPGRYEYKDGKWDFIHGKTDSHESYEYRLEVALDLYNKGRL